MPEMGAIKRVVGMPGDFVVRDLGGMEMEAKGLGGVQGGGGGGGGSAGGGERQGEMIQVPEGHCWVVGDNVPVSRDSRTYGPVPLALVQGKVICKVWPWGERGWVENSLKSVEHG